MVVAVEVVVVAVVVVVDGVVVAVVVVVLLVLPDQLRLPAGVSMSANPVALVLAEGDASPPPPQAARLAAASARTGNQKRGVWRAWAGRLEFM